DAGLGHRLDQLQRNPCFRGVLHSVLYEEDEPWLERLNVHEGLSEIARRGLPVDLLLRPQHLKQIHELADASPALQLILDHLGTSAVERDGFDSWAGEMERLSEVPHLSVKISGLIAHAESKTRLARHLRPCVQHVWHLFGPDRCLFGSGWPVLQDAGTWKQALATFTQALGPLSKELRAGVIGVNAARVYRL
ncbi:MAG TPA: amidohydrolase family protein, partial [Bryobacteraceae bacterium]|nr:amidohydrolase family protein [Bryobacteraceae bacterium]